MHKVFVKIDFQFSKNLAPDVQRTGENVVFSLHKVQVD